MMERVFWVVGEVSDVRAGPEDRSTNNEQRATEPQITVPLLATRRLILINWILYSALFYPNMFSIDGACGVNSLPPSSVMYMQSSNRTPNSP